VTVGKLYAVGELYTAGELCGRWQAVWQFGVWAVFGRSLAPPAGVGPSVRMGHRRSPSGFPFTRGGTLILFSSAREAQSKLSVGATYAVIILLLCRLRG
jgi:hypothetical protein